IYSRDYHFTAHADNRPYAHIRRHQVTVIDRNPDCLIPEKGEALQYGSFTRAFPQDGVHHDSFELYFSGEVQMAALTWDGIGERRYTTGTDHGVLCVAEGANYGPGVAWNGLTAVTDSPSGAEATAIYADNIKYLNLISAEDFGGTIEAYNSPEEFD